MAAHELDNLPVFYQRFAQIDFPPTGTSAGGRARDRPPRRRRHIRLRVSRTKRICAEPVLAEPPPAGVHTITYSKSMAKPPLYAGGNAMNLFDLGALAGSPGARRHRPDDREDFSCA